MKSYSAYRAAVLTLVISLGSSACGGSGSSDSGDDDSTEPFAPIARAIIYFTSNFQLGGASDTVNTTVHQYVPESDELLTVAFSQSFSFARSSLYVHSFDDNLVTLRNTGTSGFGGGDWEIKDLDAVKDSSALVFPARSQQSTNEGNSRPNCVAVSDDSIYWLSPELGGGLKTIGLTDAAFSESLLILATQPEACFEEIITGGRIGGMDFADGVWYSTRFNQTTGLIDFFSRDLTTGMPTALASLTAVDHAQYDSRYAFGFDRGQAYWARVHATTNVIEVWSYDFIGPPQNLLTATPVGITPTAVTQLDVDDGIVVFKIVETSIFNDTKIMLFDSNNMTSQVIDLLDQVPAVGGLLPPTFDSISVMYREP